MEEVENVSNSQRSAECSPMHLVRILSNDVPSRLEYRFTCCLIRSLVSTSFVRVVRVMRTAVMGPGTANDTTGEMASPTNETDKCSCVLSTEYPLLNTECTEYRVLSTEDCISWLPPSSQSATLVRKYLGSNSEQRALILCECSDLPTSEH